MSLKITCFILLIYLFIFFFCESNGCTLKVFIICLRHSSLYVYSYIANCSQSLIQQIYFILSQTIAQDYIHTQHTHYLRAFRHQKQQNWTNYLL